MYPSRARSAQRYEIMKQILAHYLPDYVALAILIVGGLIIAGCSQSDPIPKPDVQRPSELTRYRISHNKLLYDVTLRDGSRCVVVTGGGTYCEFDNEDD